MNIGDLIEWCDVLQQNLSNYWRVKYLPLVTDKAKEDYRKCVSGGIIAIRKYTEKLTRDDSEKLSRTKIGKELKDNPSLFGSLEEVVKLNDIFNKINKITEDIKHDKNNDKEHLAVINSTIEEFHKDIVEPLREKLNEYVKENQPDSKLGSSFLSQIFSSKKSEGK